MRISDWSSDVCSSDLGPCPRISSTCGAAWPRFAASDRPPRRWSDRKSVVEGMSVSVRVDLGGRRIIKKKNTVHNVYQNYYTINQYIVNICAADALPHLLSCEHTVIDKHLMRC